MWSINYSTHKSSWRKYLLEKKIDSLDKAEEIEKI